MRPAELEAYLDEALPPEEMARVEQMLRTQPQLLTQLAAIHARRDAGLSTLGELWRRHRLSCLSREEWGSYLLGTLDDERAGYAQFHLEMVGCRYCRANLSDLEEQQAQRHAEVQSRRHRYFESSAGLLRRDPRGR